MATFKIYNATELWQRETCLPSIPSFSLSLDNALGNDGLQLGTITELIGLPGSGKTQLCLQFCASVQIPKILGGLSAEALYIDTNTNFSIYRFKEILFASLSKCQRLLQTSIAVQEEDALKKLHYMDAIGLEKFCASIHNLPKFVQQHPNVRLIVIDSIAFPFKEGISTKERTGLLFRLMAELHKTAFENQIAVMLTNEMSTRVGLSSGTSVGALGDAWAHRCSRRLLLAERGEGQRAAVVLKSNSSPNAVGTFKVHSCRAIPGSVRALEDAWAHRCSRRLLLAERGEGQRAALVLKSNSSPNAVGTFKITEEGIRDIE